MSEAKKSGSSRTLWLAIISGVVLLGGIVAFNYDSWFAPTSQSAGAAPSGLKMPSSAKPGMTSGQGTLRSTGDMNAPQSLSGQPINGQQTVATGQVVDEKGRGVPDVRVQCTSCQTSAALALTDPGGNFKLPYRFAPTGDVQNMIITVSKEKKSSKHTVQPGNTIGLKLELK